MCPLSMGSEAESHLSYAGSMLILSASMEGANDRRMIWMGCSVNEKLLSWSLKESSSYSPGKSRNVLTSEKFSVEISPLRPYLKGSSVRENNENDQ